MKDKYRLIEIEFMIWTLCGYEYAKQFYINGRRVQESEFHSLRFWLDRGDYDCTTSTKNDRNRNGVNRNYWIAEYQKMT